MVLSTLEPSEMGARLIPDCLALQVQQVLITSGPSSGYHFYMFFKRKSSAEKATEVFKGGNKSRQTNKQRHH